VPKSKAEPAAAAPTGYYAWSRDPAVSLFAVLPLWLAYEVLRVLLTPSERNGAEVLLRAAVALLGTGGGVLLRLGLGVAVFVAMRSVQRRAIPWARVLCVIALEGMVYGLLLGPIADALTPAKHLCAGAVDPLLVQNLVASLGAGIFEELVFRLLLMSALAWLCLRATHAFALPRWVAGVAAVAGSAVLFAWFHHFCGEQFVRSVFVFRAVAGAILGFLFWFRGYGVCVYTHAMYDVYVFLAQSRP
jgi:membrane protease YdiL (CAAX protease family)